MSTSSSRRVAALARLCNPYTRLLCLRGFWQQFLFSIDILALVRTGYMLF